MSGATREFAGRVAIVTGGASGIGRALGRELVARGARVVLADRQVALAEEVARELGAVATAAELDVRDPAAFERLVDEVAREAGSVDYLFNNAGIAVGGEMADYDMADWNDVLDVNLRGVIHGVQAVYPRMIRQGRGHIINTASMAGLVATPGEGSYTATKHAVVGLSKSLRIEARRHGVRVSALCPGAVRTPIVSGGKYGRIKVEGVNQEQLSKLWERLRPIDPAELARVTLDEVAKDVGVIVVPRWWKALWYLDRWLPPVSSALWAKLFEQLRRELKAGGAKI